MDELFEDDHAPEPHLVHGENEPGHIEEVEVTPKMVAV
jgi:hypothetical protein